MLRARPSRRVRLLLPGLALLGLTPAPGSGAPVEDTCPTLSGESEGASQEDAAPATDVEHLRSRRKPGAEKVDMTARDQPHEQLQQPQQRSHPQQPEQHLEPQQLR